MSNHRLYNPTVARKWIHGQTQMIVAEVNWDYSHEFSDLKLYPDDWDELRKLGFYDHSDAAIHMWLAKYRPDMYEWLKYRNIRWTGTQSGDTEDTRTGSRGFTVVCVTLKKPEEVTEFVLTWG